MKGTLQKEPKTTSPTAGNHRQEFVSAPVNIFETNDGYILEAEMPGVSKEGLEVTLEANEITLVGRRTDPPVSGTPLFRERHLADYQRVFELDPAIDTGTISAKIDQGLVTLVLPKSERVKPRKIAVTD